MLVGGEVHNVFSNAVAEKSCGENVKMGKTQSMSTLSSDELSSDDLTLLANFGRLVRQMRQTIGQIVAGQDHVVEELLVTLFANGHLLLIGVPGLAKTLLIRTLSDVLGLSFRRIQFTPDLMPSDITGTDVLQQDPVTGRRELVFQPGPLFAHVILADEINRTPPRTQAALLEAMQERQITTGGVRRPIESPFFDFATQNPIEQEGTYPLPEAQLDRFLMASRIGYPTEAEEMEMIRRTTADRPTPQIVPILQVDELQTYIQLVRRVPIAEHLVRYVLKLVRATRPLTEDMEMTVGSEENFVGSLDATVDATALDATTYQDSNQSGHSHRHGNPTQHGETAQQEGHGGWMKRLRRLKSQTLTTDKTPSTQTDANATQLDSDNRVHVHGMATPKIQSTRRSKTSAVALENTAFTVHSNVSSSVADWVTRYVRFGAGPRASQSIVIAAKARAAMKGRCFVDRTDIHAVLIPVLRHRVLLNFSARAENISVESVIAHLASEMEP